MIEAFPHSPSAAAGTCSFLSHHRHTAGETGVTGLPGDGPLGRRASGGSGQGGSGNEAMIGWAGREAVAERRERGSQVLTLS